MKILLLLPAFLFTNQVAFAQPSFDCGKTLTKVETKICGNELLAKADRELAVQYSGLIEALKDPQRIYLRKEQALWLKTRDRCLKKIEKNALSCLAKMYGARADELDTLDLLRKYPRGPEKEAQRLIRQLEGKYCVKATAAPYGEPEGDDVKVTNELLIQSTLDPSVIQFQFSYNLLYAGDSCDAQGVAVYTGKNEFTHIQRNEAAEEKLCRFVIKMNKKSVTMEEGEDCIASICQSKGANFETGEFPIARRVRLNKKRETGPLVSVCGK